MASRIVITCDRCGEVIKTRKPDEDEGCISKVNVWVKETSLYDMYDKEWNGRPFQLCSKCASKLQQFLTAIDSEIIERKAVSAYDPNRFVKKVKSKEESKRELTLNAKTHHFWTDEEREYLKAHLDEDAAVLAVKFGTTVQAITSQKYQIRVATGNRPGRGNHKKPIPKDILDTLITCVKENPHMRRPEMLKLASAAGVSESTIYRLRKEVLENEKKEG